MIRLLFIGLMILLGPLGAVAENSIILDMARSEPLSEIKMTSVEGSVSIMKADYSVTTHLPDGNICVGTYSVSKRLVRIDNVVKWLTNSEDNVSESIVKVQISYLKCQTKSTLEGTRLSFVTPERFPLNQVLRNSTTVLTANGERGISQTQYVFSANQ